MVKILFVFYLIKFSLVLDLKSYFKMTTFTFNINYTPLLGGICIMLFINQTTKCVTEI